MYESPITRIVEDIAADIMKREEDYLVESVHKVGFDIDKEELAKALRYDRDQYEKGFMDGRLSMEPRWNNHEVACIIADLMGDACACNVNGIDEWLPRFCDFANTDACPHPVGVACWEQFLKWKGENDDRERKSHPWV